MAAPLSDCNSERTATAEQENFIGHTPCLCVCVCVCWRERGREIQEELQPEQSLRALFSGELTAVLSPPLASFQIPSPSALVLFHPRLAPSGFLSPRLSGQQLCRDLPVATAREGESRGKKRRRETDQSITLILKKEALGEERRGSSSISLCTFLLQRIFCDSYYSLLKHLNHVLPLEREDS